MLTGVLGTFWLGLGCLAGTSPKMVEPFLVDTQEMRINMDGELSDLVWSEAVQINDFVEVWPESHSSPALQTRVRIFYGQSGLYIGFWCEQGAKNQNGRLSSRDNQVERDWIRVSIDPVGNGAQAYFMELGLGGSQRDGTILAEREYNDDWDGPWIGRTRSGKQNWTGEIYLPWSMFPIPQRSSGSLEMGIHLERWVSYLGERHSWEPLTEKENRFLSGFSRMKVTVDDWPATWTLVPYAAGTQDRLAGSSKGKGGADFFWSPTPGIKLSATVFPDFGQVESDELVVNLSAFETFFPEKRSFFLEDRDIFDTRKYKLVHTRRIGGAPDKPVQFQDAVVNGLDKASDIQFAIKATGQMGNNQYGFMAVSEDDAPITINEVTNSAATKASSPGRDYLAGRFKHETITEAGHYLAHGWLGTFVDRHALDRRAMVHSYDGTLRDGEGKWRLNWQVLASRVKRVGKEGYGAWFDGSWQQSRGVRHGLELVYFDDKIELNDLGFLWRNDQRWIEYDLLQRRGGMARWLERVSNFSISLASNNAGQIIRRKVVGRMNFETRKRLNWEIFIENESAPWNDRISRGNGAVRAPAWVSVGFGLKTDERKRFGLSLWSWAWNEWKKEKRLSTNVNLGLRFTPNDHLSLRFDGTMRDSDGRLLWLEDTRFAAYELLEIIPSLRMDLLLSPRQDIRFIGQWAGIEGDAFAVYESGPDGKLESLDHLDAKLEDFSRGDLALQVRYRYELAPLSELFAVYSLGGFIQSAQPVEQTSFSDLLSDAYDHKIADQVLIKVRYRF